MNVKSKYDVIEKSANPPSQYLRGACTAFYSLVDGPARVDISSVHAPKFIKKILRGIGWKTESDQQPNY